MIDFMAPEVGLEPTTLRLTAECSAIELLRSVLERRGNRVRSISYNKKAGLEGSGWNQAFCKRFQG